MGDRVRLQRVLAAAAGVLDASAGEEQGERRQVTVLFADIVGFTRLSSAHDAEDVHALLNRFFAAADAQVQNFGGHVDKHIGDAVMAVFGAPVAHGDDPERAIRAAAALHEDGGNFDPPIELHIGIASGEVVASRTGSTTHSEYTVTGDTVNLAARLEDLAEPGQTLISDAVYEQVSTAVVAEPAGQIPIRGLAEPVAVWRLEGLRTGGTGPGAGRFVGRVAEIGQFQGLLDPVAGSAMGAVVILKGQVGLGKTQLLQHFVALAEAAGFAAHGAAVLDFGAGAGRDAVGALTRSLLGLAPGVERRERAAAAASAEAEGMISTQQRLFLDRLLDLPLDERQRPLYDAMTPAHRAAGQRAALAALASARAKTQALLLFIENLHWADGPVLETAAALAGLTASTPILLVLTTRPEPDPLDAGWCAGSGSPNVVVMDLGPLSEAEALELAVDRLQGDEALARRCVERADGNPLFLDQLLRNAERGGEKDVPATVQSVVQARLDALSAAPRRALQAASVLGQHFALATLRDLIEEPAIDTSELERHALIAPVADGYRFDHALVREGAYASLLRERRRPLHRRAAQLFRDSDPVLWASHLVASEDTAAAAACIEVARGLMRTYRFDEARQLTAQGLGVAVDNSARSELLCLDAELLRLLGRPEQSSDVYSQALELDDGELAECRIRLGLAANCRLMGAPEQGLQQIERAEAIAEKLELTEELSMLFNLRGGFYFIAGDPEGAQVAQRRALELARRARNPEREAEALGGLGDALYARGEMHEAMASFRACVELSQANGFGRIESANRTLVGVTLRYLNQMAAAQVEYDAALDHARLTGNQRAEIITLLQICELQSERDDFDTELSSITRGVAIADEIGNPRHRCYLRSHLGRALLQTGRGEEARQLLRQVREMSREIDDSFIGARVRGSLALALEDPDERRQALAEGEAIVEAGVIMHNVLWFRRDAIEVCLQLEDWGEARRHARALEVASENEPLPWSDFFIARGRALAGAGEGRRDAALAAELAGLIEQARETGHLISLPKLAAASAALTPA